MHLSHFSPAMEVLWKLLKENHINPERVFSKYNLNHSDLKNTEQRIPLKIIPHLWNDAYDLVESPCFGLNAYKYWHPSYLGALGYAWLSSKTLREGFTRLSRFISILSHSGPIDFQESDTEFSVIFFPHITGINPARSDNALSTVLHMCRINYQEELNPNNVTFTHSKPECVGDYFSYFKSDVRFDAEFDSLTFSQEVMDTPLPGANKQLAQLNDQVMIQYLKELTLDGLEERVKAIIVNKLPSGIVTGNIVAQELSMSHRNLQRKLTELNTTFKKLLKESRHYLAEKYVTEGKMNMTEITFMLGFSELSSFSRAYKRWTGHSPRAQ